MKNKTPFCDLFLLLFDLNHFFSSHDSFNVLVKLHFLPQHSFCDLFDDTILQKYVR